MTVTEEELIEYNRYRGKIRLTAARAAEEAGMVSYFKNIYADFMCCGSIEELKEVAAEFTRYKLHQIRPVEVVQADLDDAKTNFSRAKDVEKLQKELITSLAYQAGNVFEMLGKLRELYTRLYDELKENATSAKTDY